MKTPYDLYDYPQYWEGREYEDLAEKRALKIFFNQISGQKKGQMIDIGAGFGRHAPLYAPLYQKCVLLDPSEKLLDQAQSRLKKYTNLSFKLGRAEKIPFKEAQFEAALLIRVIHHLPEPKKAFLEVLRVLKPQGYFILEFANKIHFLAKLRAWLKADFGFIRNLESTEQSSRATIRKEGVHFLNHHPEKIRQDLLNSGFKIIDCLSVSNFRSEVFKKLLPAQALLRLEAISQKPLAKCHFGPSIFLLCQKP